MPAFLSASWIAVAISGLVSKSLALECVRVTVSPFGWPASFSSSLALAGSPVLPAGKRSYGV